MLAEAGPGLGSARGPGAVPGCRQDVSSSPGSAADLERTESEVGKSQKRTHFINSFFFFLLNVFGVLVCSLAAS